MASAVKRDETRLRRSENTKVQGRSNVFGWPRLRSAQWSATIKLKTRNKKKITETYALPLATPCAARSRLASPDLSAPLCAASRLVLPRLASARLPRLATKLTKARRDTRSRLCRHVTTNENNVGACIYERYRGVAPLRRASLCTDAARPRYIESLATPTAVRVYVHVYHTILRLFATVIA